VRSIILVIQLFILLIHCIYSGIFDYASATGQASSVTGFHKHVDKWNAAWQLSAPQLRSIHSKMIDLLAQDNQHLLALAYLTKYFNTFPAEAALPAEATQKAQSIIIRTLKFPISMFNERTSLLRVSADAFLTVCWSY
jgi:hypothetical protein